MGIEAVQVYREGSDMYPKVEDYPLHLADLSGHPLLALAVSDTRVATNVKVEWLVEELGSAREVLFNYTQIVRSPFLERGPLDRGVAFTRHLDAIERILWDGVPTRDHGSRTSVPFSTCGGVRYYLKRDPVEGDKIMFRPLRQTMLKKNCGPNGESEFLTEFSLQVIPAKPLVRAV